MKNHQSGYWRNPELFFWIAALIFMARLDPVHPPDFSLCLWSHLGLPCPGCGLGRSLAYLFHGQIAASFLTHPLGLPALLIIGHRIIQLIRNLLISYKPAQDQS
jgi:hypothetical protein